MRGGVVGFEVLLEFVDLNINKVLVDPIEWIEKKLSWLFKHCVAISEWMMWHE
jgi:hypothetical protein